jgi:hypothetical protein
MEPRRQTDGRRAQGVRILVVTLIAAAALGGAVSPCASLGIDTAVAACQGGTGAGGGP